VLFLWKKTDRDVSAWVTHGDVVTMVQGQMSALLFQKQSSDILYGKWHSTPFVRDSVYVF